MEKSSYEQRMDSLWHIIDWRWRPWVAAGDWLMEAETIILYRKPKTTVTPS